MSPVISVVMPVWNGEKYLSEAVDSILAQTFKDFELIIVDDGSTDGTAAILGSYSDSRLQIHHLEHGGIVMALNHGVAKARASWIARQDADDISLPGRLQAQWDAVQNARDVTLCFTAVELVGESAGESKQPRFPRSNALIALRLCYQCDIAHTAVMFQKQTFLASGGYRPEERHAEDFAAWGRLLEFGRFIGLPEPLVLFRRHSQSISIKNLAAQNVLKGRVAVAHCRRFMSLSENDAQRVHAVLSASSNDRPWSEWWWFLIRCAPRLRWQSFEMWSWLAFQTFKLAVRTR